MPEIPESILDITDFPLAEALYEGYSALCEGMTDADMRLGEYIRSLDGDNPIQKPSDGTGRYDLYMYMFLARNAKAVSELLEAASAIHDYEGKEGMSRIRDVLDRYSDGTADPSFIRNSATRLANCFVISDAKSLSEASRMYAAGNTRSGYEMLKWAVGSELKEMVFMLSGCWTRYNTDANQMVMHPDPKESRVVNKWLVHWTNPEAALNIAKNGFDRGNRLGELAYNNSSATNGMEHNYTGKYLFAFRSDDYGEWSIYGTSAIMFVGSGYRVYHKGDDENQVIFDYREPRACYLIMPRYDAEELGLPCRKEGDYHIYGQRDGKPVPIYSCGSMESCVDWVETNGRQYARMMFRWK